MSDDVPKAALAARLRGETVHEIARRVVAISHQGLKARRKLDSRGEDEQKYLEFVDDVVARGATPADDLLASYAGAWGGDIDHVFKDYAFA